MGMKTASPWMPEGADESVISDVIRDMLELNIRIALRDDGFRIFVRSTLPEIRHGRRQTIPRLCSH